MEDRDSLSARTNAFAIRIVRMFRALPQTPEALILGKQALRSGTAIAANYRAARRARSKAEFIAKLGVVVEEADESSFWLDLLVEADIVPSARMGRLRQEATELLKIFARSVKSAKRNQSANRHHATHTSRRRRRQ